MRDWKGFKGGPTKPMLFLVGRIIFGGYFVMSSANPFFKVDMMSGYAKSKGTPA
jgi:hypothetical protein